MTRIYMSVIAAMVLLASLQANAQTTWFKYSGNPVLSYGAAGSWEANDVGFPHVIRMQDTLKMWYTGERVFSSYSQIGYAWSTDGGISWTKHGSNPVLAATQSWEGGLLYASYVVFSGSEYKMWYSGGFGTGYTGFARSTDGVHWTKCVANPVLSPGPSVWDKKASGFPCVLVDGGGYKMWYNGADWWYNQMQIGYATATNETTWTKVEAENPVLAPSIDSWDGPYLRMPRVVYDGQLYGMWFDAGTDIYLNHHVGYATSLDGMHWTKISTNNPVLKAGPSAWDAMTISGPDVLIDGSFYHMWYAGTNSICYAVSPKGLQDTIIPSRDVAPGTTVKVVVRIDNPDKSLAFYARLESRHVGIIKDSLELFDDGMNGDSLKDDGIYGIQWIAPQYLDTISVKLGLRLRDTLRFSEVPLQDLAVPVTPGHTSTFPGEYSLGQNYPNPFNPSTSIEYSVGGVGGQGSGVSNVQLIVYDVLGREVAVLVNERKPPGMYTVQFDATGLASGIYLYRLTSGDFVATRKLLLLK